MKQKVYIETSTVSYLIARPSRDLIIAANQQVTREWWNNHRSEFDLYISQVVLKEAGEGDKEAAQQRLEALQGIPLLELKTEALSLANRFVRDKALPKKASDDALHIAVASIYGIDDLVTWNCKHIANAVIQKSIARITTEQGYKLPIICTPYELIGR
jgi:predicted nucleic acid-binding protein